MALIAPFSVRTNLEILVKKGKESEFNAFSLRVFSLSNLLLEFSYPAERP